VAKLDVAELRALTAPHRIEGGRGFELADHDPGATGGFGKDGKRAAQAQLEKSLDWLEEAQRKLWAQDRWALLLVFQGMDASGKDSVIRHLTAGLNPLGCAVHAFKAPTGDELDHDFLWRHAVRAPRRGEIGIFNRSHYEEVLVVRVHPELLDAQRLPPALAGDDLWDARLEDIRDYERHLGRNGTVVRKFFLNVSRDEQKQRFLERLDEPTKHWKFAARDVQERGHWASYQRAYEDAIRKTATAEAPWFVVPADHKWYTRLVVAAAVVETLLSLDVDYPATDPARRAALERAREELLAEEEASG
jgi:PPK2 family polyphosphate:nucleotide phosphotransferase